jgi:DNA ligase D-like protein (predicted ligase)
MQIHNSKEARQSGINVFYYLFDMIYIDGYDISSLELLQRKQLLHRAINFKDPVRFTAHIDTGGEAYYQEACKKGWEGVIAKRADSPYVSVRSKDWLKFKCVNEQEFVIGGYTDPKGQRTGFGALLVGYYDDDKLIYAGKVGTGFNDKTLHSLSKKLANLKQDNQQFFNEIKEKGAHWVKPELVAQVGFTEWTKNGMLRHPRFLGLRLDKPAEQVIREG